MTTSTWASWTITCECQPSDFEKIGELAAEMTDFFLANEPLTTHFEWSANADRNQIHIHERYADSSQAMSHMAAFGEQFGARFMALLKPVSVVAYGYPSSELRTALEGLSPTFMENFSGFQR